MYNNLIRILLVDDDEDDYLITRDFVDEIERGQYELEWVQSYEDALKAIERREHDIYLFDYRLGEHNGLELVRAAVDAGCRAPVILLTGQGDHEIDVEAMRAGASDYLTKGQINSSMLERSMRYAIERMRTLEMLREMSIHDELTGLYNRREMSRILKDAIQRAQRYDRPTALIMVDIDYFKSVNDTYGHQAGDSVLKQLSQLLREQMRSVDYLARYGGEELAIILPETSSDDAMSVAERVCRKVADHHFTSVREDGETFRIPVTISLGVSSLPGDAATEEALIRASDQALYEAKRTGRNRAVLYNQMLHQPTDNKNVPTVSSHPLT